MSIKIALKHKVESDIRQKTGAGLQCGVPSFRQRILVALALLAFGIGVSAQEKIIHLRNEVVKTAPAARLRQSQPSQAPVSQLVTGLFVIQFEQSFQETWRNPLGELHVDLLRAVPEDAFVALLSGTDTTRLQALAFVRFVMPYRPEHKVHAPLKALQDAQLASVSVLLSPRISAAELALAHRLIPKGALSAPNRFGQILRGELTGANLKRLSNLNGVLWIEGKGHPKLYDEKSVKIISGNNPGGHLSAVQNLGFDGKGVVVSVADSGLDDGDILTMHPDLAGRVDDFFFYGQLTDAADEHSHGTHVAGIIAGDGATGEMDDEGYLYGLGMAPKAHLVAQRIFDGVGGYEPPPSNEVLTHDAVRAGAIIGSNSWGDDTQGRYDLSAMEFDALVRDADKDTPGDQQYILEFSAGNAGPGERTIGSPAVGKNVIATGACENDRLDFFIYDTGPEAIADFSSRGPCEDGRIKPDVVAPGTWIASLQSSSASDENSWSAISDNYQYQGGTSQAGPHASGAAALFVQYYRDTHGRATPSPALVKAALINCSVDTANADVAEDIPAPNNDEGWGRIDLTQIIGSARKSDFIDQSELLASGQTYERRFVLADATVPLKITLAYTDVPGAPFATVALVNDLDLELISPSGVTFRGNQFVEGESAPNPAGFDRINNVEGIYLSDPEVGEYIVRVHASNVLEDARRDTVAVDQDFALVISAALPLPGQGVIAFDRLAYTAPSTMQLKLIDFDLARRPDAAVSVTTTSEPAPLLVSLKPFGTAGVFTGYVTLEASAPKADDRLQVKHGDIIRASYQDQSPASTIASEVPVDFKPPVITDLHATNQFGREFIFWRTDEEATSIVRYGTNGNLILSVTNRVYDVEHEIGLPQLIPGRTYQFVVISTDFAGNSSTNNNNGTNFTFVAQQPAAILLVDAYSHGAQDDSIPLPLSTYTDPLDQIGLRYDVWDVASRGSPKQTDLSPFRVVIWRINNSFYEGQGFTAAQSTAVQQYLANGGAFFMAGMDVLSHVDGAFQTNVFHVAEFIRNPNPFDTCATCDEDHGVPEAEGLISDPITSGMDLVLDYSSMPFLDADELGFSIGPDLSDTFIPSTNAAAIFLESQSKRPAGLRYPRTGQDSSNGRVVFLAFPLEAVPLDGPSPNTRADLLRNSITFLAPGLEGLGTIALDNPTYRVPAPITIEVSDSDLAGAREITVQAYTGSATNGLSVKLFETAQAGVFRGNVILSSNPKSATQIRAKGGDYFWAEYLDKSTQRLLRALASIDNDAPLLTGMTVEPAFEEATITWNTSEPATALVQFGESSFLSRTVFDAALREEHSLRLIALQPDKIYYFQIVSRDEAGNTTVDDNAGKLYTFRTLKPLRAPWVDNLDTFSTNWTVFNADGSEGAWQFGPPGNQAMPAAHTPPNVWSTLLNGGVPTYEESYLISPAVELSGGNRAALHFWHQYEFDSENAFEIGALLLFTNSLAQPITLAEYGDATVGWEEEVFDLTPYLGRIVQIVWQYQMIDLGDTPVARTGWNLDDISIVITNQSSGSVVITNNLAQAGYSVEGPQPYNGQGWGTVLTNAVAGTYIVRFNDVPYYHTPAAQTNILARDGQQIVFKGQYTFDDANNNGISDAWETRYFNRLLPAGDRKLDSDQDGASDFAEFYAGTDPTDPASNLHILPETVLSNSRLKLTWPSVPGRYYRVLGSTDAIHWTPFSGWLRALVSETSYQLPSLAANKALFFTVEVSP